MYYISKEGLEVIAAPLRLRCGSCSRRWQAISALVGGIGICLTIGRIVGNRKSKNKTARCADYLNGAAAAVLVALLALQYRYLPLQYAIVQRAGGDFRVVLTRDDIRTFYRVEFAAFVLFWTVLYLVKLSFLMLYRGLFRISETFRKWWWAALGFTAIAFLVDLLGSLWLCGPPSGLFDIGTNLVYRERGIAR